MPVAALYDIHGNLPALEAVLLDVRQTGVDRIVIGGDVVPGPMPREVVAEVLDLGVPTYWVRGNGEREVRTQISGGRPTVPEPVREIIRWVGDQLTPHQLEALGTWPEKVSLEIEGLGRVLFCHASPRSDSDLLTRRTPAELVEPLLEGVTEGVVVCGHTHMQFDRIIGGTRVVNAGSVGMPFGDPGAYWLLLGPEVALRRTAYDLEGAAERVRATDYPQAEEFAAGSILEPPIESRMIEVFDRAAAR